MARSRQERLVYQLLLPGFGAVFVLATIPFVLAVVQAVTSDNGSFIGLDNFARALGNPLLYESIKQTGLYASIALPIEILGGLGIALLVHRTVRSSAIRAAIYIAAMIPIVIPQIAVGVVFRLVFAPDYGILNVLLGQTGANQPLWLSSPPLAMIATATVDIWQWTPFVYLVLFFRIADVIRVFDHVYVLTGGGPGTTTQFLSLYIYRIGFKFSDLGQASALAVVVMVAMILFYTVVSRFLPADRG